MPIVEWLNQTAMVLIGNKIDHIVLHTLAGLDSGFVQYIASCDNCIHPIYCYISRYVQPFYPITYCILITCIYVAMDP
jgi:hypothetical protein